MRSIFIFSKTNWDEVPRLRHQVAKLVQELGMPIYFFQKPAFGCFPRDSDCLEIRNGLYLLRTSQAIHHQLRWFSFLRLINSYFETSSIRKSIFNLPKPKVIFNFNYDYYFLRDIFPESNIITIINDDFVAQSRFFNGFYIEKALSLTCMASDNVLAVSNPILNQVSKYCNPKLFLPWSDAQYSLRQHASAGNKILLWGHIDGRIDFDLLRIVLPKCPEFHLDIVGPVSSAVISELKELITFCSNVSLLPPADLDDIDLAEYFCSVIPYKNNQADILAVTISNKTFQILSRGIPVVTHGMPNFYNDPSIIKTIDSDGFVSSLHFVRKNFFELQPSIESLIKNNTSDSRLKFLKSLIH